MILRTTQLATAVLGLLLLLYAIAAGDNSQGDIVRTAGMILVASSFLILSYRQFSKGGKHD